MPECRQWRLSSPELGGAEPAAAGLSAKIRPRRALAACELTHRSGLCFLSASRINLPYSRNIFLNLLLYSPIPCDKIPFCAGIPRLAVAQAQARDQPVALVVAIAKGAEFPHPPPIFAPGNATGTGKQLAPTWSSRAARKRSLRDSRVSGSVRVPHSAAEYYPSQCGTRPT